MTYESVLLPQQRRGFQGVMHVSTYFILLVCSRWYCTAALGTVLVRYSTGRYSTGSEAQTDTEPLMTLWARAAGCFGEGQALCGDLSCTDTKSDPQYAHSTCTSECKVIEALPRGAPGA